MKAKNHAAQLWAYLAKVNKEGKVALYIRVTVNRAQKFIPLKLYWPVNQYDFTRQEIIASGPRDTLHRDYSLIIHQQLAKCQEIFVQYRLRDLPLTIDGFLEEYHLYNMKRDFVQYLEDKIKRRYRNKQIEFQTKKNHTNTYNKLLEFQKKPLTFESITVKWCRSFEAWLKKEQGLKINTVWSHMKDINTYLNLAKEEDNIPLTNPFKNGYSVKSKEGDTDALTLAELEALHKLLTEPIPGNHKFVLRQFLFSCYTGLRISDLKTITQDNIVGDFLIFSPVKGRRFEKLQKIPLTKRAKAFIQADIEGKLFPFFTDQYCNRALKKLQDYAKIKTPLTNHVGRHSFATIFLELGGSVEVLQPLLGHAKISTTMRYVHVRDERKKDQMDNFDKLEF